MIRYIFQDWRANRDDPKGRLVMLHFRVVSLLRKNKIIKFLFFPFIVYNRFFIQWILGVEIGSSATIGANCRIYHGVGLVIHPDTVIGNNCVLRHGVTIGNKINRDGYVSDCPIIGNNVEFGAHAMAIGDIRIGNNVVVGAGVVVTKSIPDNTIVVSNSIRLIKREVL